MNRRAFMGTVVAGVAATGLESAGGDSTGNMPVSLPRAQWLKNGLIDAGGTHEPYIFIVRRGGQRQDARQECEHQESEDLIRRLRDQGVEVFHTHLYKGFGMAAERAEMESTRRAAQIAHRYGLKVDVYVQWDTMMYETFFAEELRAKEWIQRDVLGQPLLLPYGYQQSFRYRPCFANHEYVEYLKKVVRYAIVDVKSDFIHFDNFGLSPEPDSCHCTACVEGFRKFLTAKYSPETLRERIGFVNVEFVNPPLWNRQNPPEKMQVIYDPVIQEWIDYRCQLMSDALREIALYAKSLNSEVAIEVNCGGITGANRAWENGIDHPRILRWTEAFWSEEGNAPEYLPDGRLISRIRTFKLGRTFQNTILTYISDNPIAMAECLAFNQTIGYAGNDKFSSEPVTPGTEKYIAFYRTHRDLFLDSRDVATVAVLRSYASISYHHARAQLCAVLVEQALLQSRIPFDLIFDEHMGGLAKYKVLILPDCECLSDLQLKLIRSFVDKGGGLLAIGQSGLYDQWRRLRSEPGLHGLAEKQRGGEEYPENSPGSSTEASGRHVGSATRNEVGYGRVAYIPDLIIDGPAPDGQAYFSVRNEYWKRPRNSESVVDAARWLARADIPVSISGPDFLITNLVEQSGQQRRLVHLVNYSAKRVPELRSIEAKCSVPQGRTGKGVKVYSPEIQTVQDLSFNVNGSNVSFTIPSIKTYSITVVSW